LDERVGDAGGKVDCPPALWAMRERGCDILQVAVVAKGDAAQRRGLEMHDKSRVCCLGWKAGVWTASAAWRGALCMARQCAHEGLGIEHPLAQGHVYTLPPMLDRDNLEAAVERSAAPGVNCSGGG
jgi:hypothetical protein